MGGLGRQSFAPTSVVIRLRIFPGINVDGRTEKYTSRLGLKGRFELEYSYFANWKTELYNRLINFYRQIF